MPERRFPPALFVCMRDKKRIAERFAMRLRANNTSGFTIVEALLAVIIVSIIAAIIVPKYSATKVTKQKVYAVAHNIAQDLRYAQKMATGSGPTGGNTTNYWFKFYTAGTATDTFKVFMEGDEANPLRTTTLFGNDIRIFASSTDSYYFNSRGEPYPDSDEYIAVKDAGNNYQWNVSIIRTTGRISLRQAQ